MTRSQHQQAHDHSLASSSGRKHIDVRLEVDKYFVRHTNFMASRHHMLDPVLALRAADRHVVGTDQRDEAASLACVFTWTAEELAKP